VVSRKTISHVPTKHLLVINLSILSLTYHLDGYCGIHTKQAPVSSAPESIPAILPQQPVLDTMLIDNELPLYEQEYRCVSEAEMVEVQDLASHLQDIMIDEANPKRWMFQGTAVQFTNIVADGKAREQLQKVFKSTATINGEQEQKYLTTYRNYQYLFKDREFWVENWHDKRGLLAWWVKFVMTSTKSEKGYSIVYLHLRYIGTPADVRNYKVHELRPLLLQLTSSLGVHYFRALTHGHTLEHCIRIFQNFVQHHSGDHSKCVADDPAKTPFCQTEGWQPSIEKLENEDVIGILQQFLSDPKTLHHFEYTWINGSTSGNESFHAIRWKYMPKNKHFAVMWPTLMRVAFLDYNENINRRVIKKYSTKLRPNKTLHKNSTQRVILAPRTSKFIDLIMSQLNLPIY
jgi:hypothetical protein